MGYMCTCALCFIRCGQYDAEIRRLEYSRNSGQFDFKQIFLVKESLALMYQMMQLPAEALAQYEELEALMQNISPALLPETNWPLFSTSVSSSKQNVTPQSNTDSGERHVEGTPDGSASTSFLDKEIRGLWYEPAFQGDAILSYSINHARMRVLKNKMGYLELAHYVFARESFFYFGLGHANLCTEKAMTFFTRVEEELSVRLGKHWWGVFSKSLL